MLAAARERGWDLLVSDPLLVTPKTKTPGGAAVKGASEGVAVKSNGVVNVAKARVEPKSKPVRETAEMLLVRRAARQKDQAPKAWRSTDLESAASYLVSFLRLCQRYKSLGMNDVDSRL